VLISQSRYFSKEGLLQLGSWGEGLVGGLVFFDVLSNNVGTFHPQSPNLLKALK
jgi:hypothetical protein